MRVRNTPHATVTPFPPCPRGLQEIFHVLFVFLATSSSSRCPSWRRDISQLSPWAQPQPDAPPWRVCFGCATSLLGSREVPVPGDKGP